MDIIVPVLGESITEVTIANWLKKDGESVKLNEVLCEIESDKATMELTAESDGVLRIIAQAGTTIPIGALVCRIEPVGSTQPSTTSATPAPVPVSPAPPVAKSSNAGSAAVDIKIPTLGESIVEVIVNSWHKKDGEIVVLDEKLCDLDSDKATFEVTAPVAGKLQILAEAGAALGIGDVVARIHASSDAVAAVPNASSDTSKTAATATLGSNSSTHLQNYASPAASKILSEKDIKPADVQGTGKDGRITKGDALAAQKAAPVVAETPKTSATVAQTASTESRQSRGVRQEKMTTLRKTIAKKLVIAKNETAMLTTFNEVDMSGIMELRKKYKDKFKDKHEVGLGFMSFFTKAVCIALQEVPAINAIISGEDIIYHQYCDVSVAVSTPRGLVVPVIRNAEQMSFAEIEKEIIRLATRARDGKLSIPEMTGGTFTITNGGIFGSMLSTPILNIPQSAILGMHNIVERPVAINGQVVIRPIMYVALSYDHRIIDGKESVTFLYRVKEMLEDPTRLLLDV